MVGIPNSQRLKKRKSILTVIEALDLALSIKELLQNDTFINLRSK
jgi:hypothetical protein